MTAEKCPAAVGDGGPGDGENGDSDHTTVETFVKVPHSILNRRDLGFAAKLAYGVIAGRMGSNGESWPGVRRLAADIGADDKRTAMNAVRQLQAAGLIDVETRRGRSSVYRLAGGAQTAPVQGMHHGGAKNAPEPVQRMHLNKIKGTRSRNEIKQSVRARVRGDLWSEALAAMTSDELRTDAFREAWGEWVQYRREARKPLTASTVRRQILKLQELGHDDAIESIARSIRHGWTGLFNPDRRAVAPRSEQRGPARGVAAGTPADRRRAREYDESDLPLPLASRP